MKAEGSIKQDHILEAAIKRFSHFGVNKTTLTEIADDLDISKPLLFYYFHDKNSLIAAVAAKIINEFLAGYEVVLQSAGSVEEGLFRLVEVKRDFFKKYYLLAIQGESIDIHKVSSDIPEIYVEARRRTEELISTLLSKGIDLKTIKPVDAEKTSKLLLDTLSAFEYCIRQKKSMPEMKDIDEMCDKQKQVLELILNGLKNSTWKN